MPEPEVPASVREAALAAMEAEGVPKEGEWEPEAPPGLQPQAEEPAEPSDPEPQPAPAKADPAPAEPSPAAEADEYFGFQKGDMSDEDWNRVVSKFREQDSTIQAELRRNAEANKETAPKEPQPPAEEPEPEPLTDDAIMEMLGYSKDDPLYDVKAETVIPLARESLDQRLQVQQLVEQAQVERFERHWESTLDQLEKDYGKLPQSREALLDFAIDNGIFDPVDAYNRLAMQGRKAFQTAMQEADTEAQRKLAEAKEKASGVRPKNTATEPADPAENLTIEEYAKLAAEKEGISWADALKSA